MKMGGKDKVRNGQEKPYCVLRSVVSFMQQYHPLPTATINKLANQVDD